MKYNLSAIMKRAWELFNQLKGFLSSRTFGDCLRAAADMFEAINLIPEQMNFHGLYYVDEETAAANLEMAALHAILMTGYEIM